jgi:aspartate/methionine/tyrosine aminotransferase
VPYRLQYDGTWHVDLASVREAIGPRTRAIVTVSPNNPTGSYVKRDELGALAALGLPIVSDEVFAAYPLEASEARARTALDAGAELVFALGGLSKLCALPQMKLGWIALGGAKRAVSEALGRLELIGDAWLSVGTPVQVALPSLLAHGETTRRSIARRIEAGLRTIREHVEGSAVTALRVEGGWYATLRLPRVHDSEAWAALFLEEDGVWIHPGFLFDFDEEAYAVASLLTPTHVLSDGIARIARRVEAECR